MKVGAFQSTSESAPAKKQKKGVSPPAPISSWFIQPGSALDGPVIQRKSNCACGGGCPACAIDSDSDASIQTKLVVGEPHDQYEREADQIADYVVSNSSTTGHSSESASTAAPETSVRAPVQVSAVAINAGARMQRQAEDTSESETEEEPFEEDGAEIIQTKAAAGRIQPPPISHFVLRPLNIQRQSVPVAGPGAAAKKEEEEMPPSEVEAVETIQAKQAGADAASFSPHSDVDGTAAAGSRTPGRSLSPARTVELSLYRNRGGGLPLPAATQSFMEDRLNVDLAHVRIHADAEASQLNQLLHSYAFTVGADIYFAAGMYRPGTIEGQRLLAHELTHVVQQRKSPSPSYGLASVSVSDPADASEREADEVAGKIEAGERVEVHAAPAQGIARQTPVPGDLFPEPESVAARVQEFKKVVGEIAVYRLEENIQAIDAWKEFLAKSLAPDDLKQQIIAQEASLLYRDASQRGQQGANLFEQWTTTTNPRMRSMLGQQISGQWFGGTGCHTMNWLYNAPGGPGSPNWMTPVQQLTGCGEIGSEILRFYQKLSPSEVAGVKSFVKSLGNAKPVIVPSTSGQASPTASNKSTSWNFSFPTSQPNTTSLSAVPTYETATPVSGSPVSGSATTFKPGKATKQVMQAVRHINPYLQQLGPDGYQVLPPEAINSNLAPAELLAYINTHLQQRKADYRGLINRIHEGDVDPMTFRPVVDWLLPLADAEVLQAIEDERESEETWETVREVVIGVATIGLLIIAIAFPPSAVLAGGITAGEVTAVTGLGLGLGLAPSQIQTGMEQVQEGYNLALGTGANDVFYPEQQRQADQLLASGVFNLVLGTLVLSGSLSGLGRLATQQTGSKLGSTQLLLGSASGRFTPRAGQIILRDRWMMSVSEDGTTALIQHVDDAGLLAIADDAGVELYRLLPNGGRVTVAYRSFPTATGVAETAESTWSATVVIPDEVGLLAPGGPAASSFLPAVGSDIGMMPQWQLPSYQAVELGLSPLAQKEWSLLASQIPWQGPSNALISYTGIGRLLSPQSLTKIEDTYGAAVRNALTKAHTPQDVKAIADSLGVKAAHLIGYVGENISVDLETYQGNYPVFSHANPTQRGTDVLVLTREGSIRAKESKMGASATPYAIGASGMPSTFHNPERLVAEIQRIIDNPNLPLQVRAGFKLALERGSITWEIVAMGNIRLTASGPNVFPATVVVNKLFQSGK